MYILYTKKNHDLWEPSLKINNSKFLWNPLTLKIVALPDYFFDSENEGNS
jgi:hypothetical protein